MIRIATRGTHSATFIAGISGIGVTAPDVTSTMQANLGCFRPRPGSGATFTTWMQRAAGLMKLRPVRFRCKAPSSTAWSPRRSSGVYPELVAYGTDGAVQTVRYSMLTPMFLNELQKQSSENARQAEQIRNSQRR